jgi:arylformamidase
MGSHTGTHMDAPLHFFKNGKSLHKMPFEATIGPTRVIYINDKMSITPEELRKYNIRRGERILFKTANSLRCWKTNRFIKDFVYISKEAAKYLTKVNVRTIGVDYLSVGGDTSVHHSLLKAGIWIIEGLNLSSARKGRYDLICLPLKILNSDGAPCRAIIRER